VPFFAEVKKIGFFFLRYAALIFFTSNNYFHPFF
jgi:hypothetical protein